MSDTVAIVGVDYDENDVTTLRAFTISVSDYSGAAVIKSELRIEATLENVVAKYAELLVHVERYNDVLRSSSLDQFIIELERHDGHFEGVDDEQR